MEMTSSLSKRFLSLKIYETAIRSSSGLPKDDESNLSQHEKDELPKPPKVIHGETYPAWRQPWNEKKGEWFSKFKIFGENTQYNSAIMGFLGTTERMSYQEWRRENKENKEIQTQSYINERHDTLGSNLATAHFVCYRGGKVKFIGNPDWIQQAEDDEENLPLPSHYVQKMILEKIDCEGMRNGGLRYEGLDNFINLNGLKWLSVKGNKHIDDWGIDKLTNLTRRTLEYLDIRDCSITHRGLVALYKMSNLKLLTVSEDQNNPEVEQVCTMLEELYPELLVRII